MEQVLKDAVHYYNRASRDWGKINMGLYGRRPTFDETCTQMKMKLGDHLNEGYRSKIQGSVNLLRDAIQHERLTKKEDVCPLILVFAKVISTSDKPQHKAFIDIFKCLYYKEYAITDLLSKLFDFGLRDNYSDIVGSF